MNKQALKAIAKITHIDLVAAIKSKRHNPIMDREMHIEEELINLKESIDSYYTAGEALQQYPQVYQHISREKRAIMKHCIGLTARMLYGKKLPRPYTKDDVEYSMKRLIQLIVEETRQAGKRIDDDIMDVFRPYLSVRQRVALRDFGMDLVLRISQFERAQGLVGKLPLLRSR